MFKFYDPSTHWSNCSPEQLKEVEDVIGPVFNEQWPEAIKTLKAHARVAMRAEGAEPLPEAVIEGFGRCVRTATVMYLMAETYRTGECPDIIALSKTTKGGIITMHNIVEENTLCTQLLERESKGGSGGMDLLQELFGNPQEVEIEEGEDTKEEGEEDNPTPVEM